MTKQKYIAFSGEDQLSEELAKACVNQCLPEYQFMSWRPRQGGASGVLKNFASYVRTAQGVPIFVCLDQDQKECPPSFRQELLKKNNLSDLPDKMILSIATREAEAWLMADSIRLSQFLDVSVNSFPQYPENTLDPKAELLKIAKNSSKYADALCPIDGLGSKVGPEYNEVLCEFVKRYWRPSIAQKNCPSLARALSRLANLNR